MCICMIAKQKRLPHSLSTNNVLSDPRRLACMRFLIFMSKVFDLITLFWAHSVNATWKILYFWSKYNNHNILRKTIQYIRMGISNVIKINTTPSSAAEKTIIQKKKKNYLIVSVWYNNRIDVIIEIDYII